jgi:hypothetical protein
LLTGIHIPFDLDGPIRVRNLRDDIWAWLAYELTERVRSSLSTGHKGGICRGPITVRS